MTRKDFLKFSGLLVISSFGILGVVTELLSHASTTSVSEEAEVGKLTTPAKVVENAGASGGEAVQFGDVQASSGPTQTEAAYPLNDWTTTQTAALWTAWKSRNLDPSGAIVRKQSNLWGGNDTTGQGYDDVVSEGQGFGMKLAAQYNDQTTFNLIYKWTVANLQRTNAAVMAQPGGSNFSNTIALNCFGWHYNWDAKVVVDADPAPDAECDIITSLVWADARWGSTGTINYKQQALLIAHDVMNYFFITDSTTKYNYGPSATEYEKGKTDFQDDNSYGDPTVFRLLVTADSANSAFWTNAINGYYNQISLDTAAQVPGQGPAVGFPSDQVQIASNTSPFTIFTENQSSFGYDAVKVPYRVRWDFDFANEARAKNFLEGPAKTFVASKYSVTDGIPAQYSHDGSSNGGYTNTLFHMSYFQLLTTNDESNTTGSSLYTNWLSASKLYSFDSAKGGAFICDKPFYLNAGYFGDYWNLVNVLMISGQWKNYT